MIQMTKENFLNPSEYFLKTDTMEFYVAISESLQWKSFKFRIA